MPTVANATTTCTGTDSNGIRVTTNATTLTVAGGATVAGANAPAVTIDVPGSDYFNYSTILTNGKIADSGISPLSGSDPRFRQRHVAQPDGRAECDRIRSVDGDCARNCGG